MTLLNRRPPSILWALAALTCTPGAASAADHESSQSLADMSLQDLSRIRVFSAARRLEPTRDAAAAISVITGEDLRQARVTTLPEALRLVPGVQVGQVDNARWAVSMRGFNSREANKLLVLVDGRSIYDPLFAGMLWESHDFLLEDIERIEVIRGPGGTLWGANAFNGVINIITRHSVDTRGAVLLLTAGTEEEYILGARYGFEINDRQNARVYLKARERDSGYLEGLDPADHLNDVRTGFRWDWNVGADSMMLTGDVFEAKAGIREDATLAHTVLHRGRNLVARWERDLSAYNQIRVQFYYDHVDYDSIGFAQERGTYDLEVQQSFRVGDRHSIVWGGGHRRIDDDALSKLSGFVDVLPRQRKDMVSTLFLEDTFSLVPDTLRLMLGLKYENTDYARPRWLPNVRLAWTPNERQTWWASIAEAVRVPSRLESDLTFLGTMRIGDGFRAEEVRAYEAGHRRLLSPQLWYDFAVFRHRYDRLATTEAGGFLGNGMQGTSSGLEASVRWDPLPEVRVSVAYTYLDMDLSLRADSTGNPAVATLHEGLAARHQVAVRSTLQLKPTFDVDLTLRLVDELPAIDVPAYAQLDTALRWRPAATWELALVGQNLLDDHQPEQDFVFSASGIPTQNERSVYVQAIWRR